MGVKRGIKKSYATCFYDNQCLLTILYEVTHNGNPLFSMN